mgnify:CR=1 FL=1
MAVTTGRWIWGWRVTTSVNKLDFVDAGTTYVATLRLGDYTAAQFAAEVQRAMRAITGNSNQTCTFSFSTRKFTLAGTSVFQLLFATGANAATDCNALLGFAATDETGATSYTSDDAVGSGSSTMSTWAPTDPAVSNSPVTAAADGTTAALLQRHARAVQHETDGGLRETVWFSTDKVFRIEYRMLSASEQTNFEALMNWLETGAPANFQPSDASTNALRLVLVPSDIQNQFSWTTRTEATYPELVLVEQLART